MGCDYDNPEEFRENDRLFKLQTELMKRVRQLPAENLTVGQLLDIINVVRPPYDLHEFDQRDADVLQNIADHTRTDHHCH